MSARTQTILERFPRHVEAEAPGKVFSAVVDGLARDLDVETSALGRIRRAHALVDADEERDLHLLAALHGLRPADFELLRARLRAARAVAAALPDAEALALVPDLFGVPADALPPDELAAALRELAAYGSELDVLRAGVVAIVDLHREGNATVGALLGAAAAYAGLAVEAVAHDPERYWHIALCRDRLRLGGRVPEEDVLALEENPFRPKEIDPSERRHGATFRVLRGGLERVLVTIRVRGSGDRTVSPMVVNLDEGFGVAFLGAVPAGEELRFESDGRVVLGGASVAGSSYAFRGAVFANAAATHANDFVFDAARFAVTEPVPDAFDPAAVFPHHGGLLPAAGMALGESRWAFFVGAAHYGRTSATDVGRLAVPVFAAGRFDASVFEPGLEAAGQVGFAWQEREPFALTVWIPRRLSVLDGDDELPLRERLRLALDRHRAAGVHVYTRYADDRWTLAGGILRELDSTDPLGAVLVGTRLWPDETPQPEPTPTP